MASARPSRPSATLQLTNTEMLAIAGGTLGCALGLAAVGFGFIGAALTGPLGWGAAASIIASGGFGIAAACIPSPV